MSKSLETPCSHINVRVSEIRPWEIYKSNPAAGFQIIKFGTTLMYMGGTIIMDNTG